MDVTAGDKGGHLTSVESRLLVALTLAALAARLAWLWLEPRCQPSGDEPSWIAMASGHMARLHKGLDPFRNGLLFYPPVYPYFLGVCFRLTRSLTAVLAAQAVVGALLVPAVGRLGAQLFDRRVGLVAATVTAFYPELVWFSTHFWSETLLLTLLWWGVERLLRADAPGGGARTAFGAGALCALATLTREPVLYLLPIAAAWLAWRRPGGLRRAGAFAAAAALVILPWTARNWVVFHAFVPVSTMGSFSLWQGNSTLTHLQVYQALSGHDPVEQDRIARRKAWQAIGRRQPLWILEKVESEMPEFWKVGSEALDQLVGRGSCGPLSRRAVMSLELLLGIPYLALAGGFLLGLVRAPASRGFWLVLLVLGGYNAVHVVALATPRFRLPVLPAVILTACATVGSRLEPLDARRLVLLVLLVTYAALLLQPTLPELALWRALTG